MAFMLTDEQDDICTYYSVGSYGAYPIWFYKNEENYFYISLEGSESEPYSSLENAIASAEHNWKPRQGGFWKTPEEAEKHAEYLLNKNEFQEID